MLKKYIIIWYNKMFNKMKKIIIKWILNDFNFILNLQNILPLEKK